MYEVEIWISLERPKEVGAETLCTIFAYHQMPIRPLTGETLSFHQAKDSTLEFSIVTPIGPVRSNIVSVEIEDIRHYAVSSGGQVLFRTSIGCAPIVVPTKEDARIVCKLMTEQLGFEVDPYGLNRLSV